MDNKRIKKAIDRQISENPLFNETDRKRFYKNSEKSKATLIPVFPKILTALLAFLFIGGSIYFYHSGNLFHNPASQEEEKTIEGPVPEENTESTNIQTKLIELKQVLTNHPTEDSIEAVIEQHGGMEVKHDSEPTEEGNKKTTSYVYMDGIKNLSPYAHHSPPPIEDFNKGDINLFMTIEWERGLQSASITYLSEDKGKLVEERYIPNPIDREFKKIVGAQEPVKMDDIVLKSIARSLDKAPDELTKSDLLALEELTINASHLNGIYDVEENEEYFKAMQSLRVLKLNQAIIPGELLKHLPILEQVTFIGPTIDDLSRVSEGMQHVQYLNIQNSSFRGTVDDILQLEDLTIVNLDPSVVPDYEKLQFEGIDVR